VGRASAPLIVVQARTGSHRLPAKVLADLDGTPILEWLVRRVSHSARTDRLVVATTTDPQDDRIEELGRRLGFDVFRGHPTDVLQRFVDVVAQHAPTAVVRLSADSPFIDAEVVDTVVEAWATQGAGLAENHSRPGWPFGVAVEVFSGNVLAWLHRNARTAEHREHVTLAAYGSDEIRRVHVPAPVALRGEGLRLCIDTSGDLDDARDHCERHHWDVETPLRAMLEDLRTS
jgi:spore coat polysaccharide biosynthesis protein SpsF (cytidylyltransferase family)